MEADESIRHHHDRLEGMILSLNIDTAAKAQLLNSLRTLYEVAYTAIPKSKHH